jgi:hypothetical protein
MTPSVDLEATQACRALGMDRAHSGPGDQRKDLATVPTVLHYILGTQMDQLELQDCSVYMHKNLPRLYT